MRKNGSILISIIVILSTLMILGIAVSSAVLATTLKTQRSFQQIAAANLAEAGINKALWELNQGNDFTNETDVLLGDGSYDVEVIAGLNNSYELVATGYIPSKANPKTKRTIKVKLSDRASSSRSAFFYGVQLGDLGANLENNAYIEGNVYSGGTVTGKNGSYVKGSVIVYNSPGKQGTITGLQLKDPLNLNPPYIYNAWAHNILNSTIYGDAKYSCSDSSCITGTTVKGLKIPNSTDPDPILPTDWAIQDSDINGWKAEALLGGTLSGFSTYNGTIGQKKVNGNMTVNGIVTLTGLVHVTGDLLITNGSTLKLDSSFGSGSGTIIVDGQIHLENGSFVLGSGNAKSSIMLLSTLVNTSLTDAKPAILADNGSSGAIYYAKDGILKLNNTAFAKSFAGKGLFLSQNSYFKFDQGIRNPNFTSGPGGLWTVSDWRIIY